MSADEQNQSSLKTRLNRIIFGYDTRAGRLFDLVLIHAITISVLAVLLDSVSSINEQYHDFLYALEWGFTVLFTLEYGLRLYSSQKPGAYARSFYGLVDLISILPTYLVFLFPGAAYLIVIRILRVLRIFRILKLMRYIGEANVLIRALRQSRAKIFLFLFSVMTLMIIFGSLMFVVEGPENGFTSIPASIYWAIVTLTTVGYGDITPHTYLGRGIAALAMITGYAIIAVPTGIISSELITEHQRMSQMEKADARKNPEPKAAGDIQSLCCRHCQHAGHDADAHYCKVCGTALAR
ncbi:MAG: ion transporter [Pseudomonadales bacterium]|nr:ion transporter [Pseudomonadales bacterium]